MGGALFNMQGSVSVVNSTFSGDSAFGGTGGHSGLGLGGAIANLNGTVSVESSTLAGNTSADGGGALVDIGYDGATARSATAVVHRSILANTAGAAPDLAANAPTNVVGRANMSSANADLTDHDLVMALANAGDPARTTITGTPLTADPLLGPLGLNGGLTPTRVPADGSPAVDAGGTAGCPATDQRGVARPQRGTCDIGAVELAAPGGGPPPPGPPHRRLEPPPLSRS